MAKYANKYTEYELIGRGSYGSAHLVRSTNDQHMYVAKKIQLTNLKQKELDDSRKEVTLLQKLKHPHIVQYIESFTENDTLIIVMEYCEEGDLSFHINRKQQRKEYFPEKVILNWFLQIALALKHIHELHILHRDIKSQNIFVTSNGFVKIGDFGISRVLEHTYDQANTVVGTPYYMSPEVCENKPYTYKSDVWALGCVLYELCNLTHAFKSNNLLGLVNRIVREQVSAIPSHYSKELSDLVSKLLIKQAEQRPLIQDILNYPIIKNVMLEFVEMQGQVKMQLPIKRTGTHDQVDKIMKQQQQIQQQQQQSNAYDETMQTVQSVDTSQMTPSQRLKFKKEEEIRKRQEELTQAARSNVSHQQALQKKVQDLQGHQTQDYSQKKKQQQQYYEALKQQQQSVQVQPNQSYSQRTLPNQPLKGSMYDETLVSQYEQTSKMMQNSSEGSFKKSLHEEDRTLSNDSAFRQQMEDFDKTVDSEMCQSSYEPQQVTASQFDKVPKQQELSVTQQYQDEEFEEYNSDDDKDNKEINYRLTVKAGDNEIEEVIKLYKLNLDQTIKKQSTNKLEDINETSQESWTSSQAQSPIQPKIISTNEERVAQLKKQAITKLGSQLFNQVYAFLSHHLQKQTSAKEMRGQLEEIVGKNRMTDCMVLDEILWLENINK